MSRGGQEHSDLAVFKLQAEMLKGKSEKGNIKGIQRWGNSYLRAKIFGSFSALAILLVFFAWIGFPGYYAVMVTSAYFLLNLLFLVIKCRKDRELKSIREQQLDEFRKNQTKDY